MYIKKAVILAGGLGTRIQTESESKPKPMVEIGEMPILWHIMKNLYTQGIEEFVICLGYKGEQIKNFFQNYALRVADIQIEGDGKFELVGKNSGEGWKVVLANTGLNTMTGGRINRIQKYVKDEAFLCTYGDGLANINLAELVSTHRKHGKIGTVTAVHPATRFGSLSISENGHVEDFAEKPPSLEWVNGGFFIFEPGIFDYLNDECVLEQEPLQRLARDGQLGSYLHRDFWRPMDTLRESKELNYLYEIGDAPWVNW
jgi:glucose-1-phosphate cytidylyltransferase